MAQNSRAREHEVEGNTARHAWKRRAVREPGLEVCGAMHARDSMRSGVQPPVRAVALSKSALPLSHLRCSVRKGLLSGRDVDSSSICIRTASLYTFPYGCRPRALLQRTTRREMENTPRMAVVASYSSANYASARYCEVRSEVPIRCRSKNRPYSTAPKTLRRRCDSGLL